MVVIIKYVFKIYLPAVAMTIICHAFISGFIVIDKAYVPEIMKLIITFSSILLGFFGTLLGQLLSLKNKNGSNKLSYFFQHVSTFEFKFVMLMNVINAIVLDALSLFVLIQGSTFKIWSLMIWLGFLFAFILHQLYLYYLFIELLFLKDEKRYGTPDNAETDNTRHEAMMQNTKTNSFKINDRIKKNDE